MRTPTTVTPCAPTGIAGLGDRADNIPFTGLVSSRRQPHPGANIFRSSEPLGIVDCGHEGQSYDVADAGHGHQQAAHRVFRWPDCGNGHFDAADWLPPVNRCWFASRIVAVKRKYLLTVDRREAVALERVLSDSSSTDMVFANEALPARISAASTASLCIRASLDL